MSFKAVFRVDDKEMNVLDCSFSFIQQTDHNGQPVASVAGGHIHLLVEADQDTLLFDWMISGTRARSGSIVFYRRDALSRMKELFFTDACCVEYRAHFNAQDDRPLQVQVVLSARELQLGASVYSRPWPGDYGPCAGRD